MTDIKKILRYCIVIAILGELIFLWFATVGFIDDVPFVGRIESLPIQYVAVMIGIIYAQVIMYRRINSSWENMSSKNKILYSISIIVAFLLNPIVWIILVYAVGILIVLAILLLLALFAGPIADSQRNHNRTMNDDAKTRADISDIDRQLWEINRKL